MQSKVFDGKGNEINIIAFHPGSYLKEELNERCISFEKLANRIGIKVCNLRNILNGKSSVTINVANKIGNVIDMDCTSYVLMQAEYDKQQSSLINNTLS